VRERRSERSERKGRPDVLVLGSGVAGLWAAITAARAGLHVALVTKGELGSSATRYAQGGVAATLFPGDSSELHLSDTVAAGAGLCDVDAVRALVTEGPEQVRALMALGARFDRDGDPGSGPLAAAREGGHSVARVVHAGGDATGAEIERALRAGVLGTPVVIHEGSLAIDLLVEHGRVAGVRALDPTGEVVEVRARHTLLATGGAGQCFAVTTNPALSTGDGIAMALRAGAAVTDLEFVQFHPTALHHPAMPRPLLSEALRGEGAVLRDEHGVAFMADEHPLGDLAPRDVVSRAIALRLGERGLDHLWLDATGIEGFAARFPTIARACRGAGLDPRRELLPIAPAAHYLCGGVATDLDGATTLPGLWACGETACAGVHGANRLASNSLLDGLVFAARAVRAITVGKDEPDATGVLRGLEPGAAPAPPRATTATSPVAAPGDVPQLREQLQHAMTRDAGVLRDAASLARAARAVDEIAGRAADRAEPDRAEPDRPEPDRPDRAACELRNLITVSAAVVAGAAARAESRGTHTRRDHPEPRRELLGRFVLRAARTEPVLVPLAAPARSDAP